MIITQTLSSVFVALGHRFLKLIEIDPCQHYHLRIFKQHAFYRLPEDPAFNTEGRPIFKFK